MMVVSSHTLRAAAAVIVVSAAVAFLRAQQTPVFRATGAIVTVDVAVRNGRALVPGLSTTDFALTDNAVPQRIDAASTASVPIDLTLVMDVSASTATRLGLFRDEAQALMKLLQPTDRLRVITIGSNLREVVGFEAPPASLPLDGLRSGGSTSLVDGVLLALQDAPNPDRQPIVVVFTDGGENSSLMSGATLEDVAARGDAVLDIALAEAPGSENAECASASASGSGLIWQHCTDDVAANAGRALTLFTPERYWSGDAPRQSSWVPPGATLPAFGLPFVPVLRDAAAVTGGAVLDVNANVTGSFRNVVDDFRHSYVLRYTPAGVTPNGWHEVTVTVPAHPEWTVTARKRYFGG